MAHPLDELLKDVTRDKGIMKRPFRLLNKLFGDRNKRSYKETIDSMIRSIPVEYPLPQQSSEDLENKQAAAPDTLPTEEDEREYLPSELVLSSLQQSGLSRMVFTDEIATLISKRPKKGKLYSTLETNVSTMLNEIRTRGNDDGMVMKDLIDIGSEIAGVVLLLMILGKSTNEIESVVELAKELVNVSKAASTLQNEGEMLLWNCISKLRSMNFDEQSMS